MHSEHFVPTHHPRVPAGTPEAGQVVETPESEHRKHVAVAVGWWPETISDGGCHYGEADADGLVQAVCDGHVFFPEVNPYLQKAVRQHSPADKEHACPACRKKHRADQ